MPTGTRKSAGNIAINRGSILLLFTDHEAKIARDWQFVKKPVGAKGDQFAARHGLDGLLAPDA